MLKGSLIIPLPPGSAAQAWDGTTKEAVGLYPCLNDHCTEWALVKLDNKGWLYVQCSQKELTVRGCGAPAKVDPRSKPEQTYSEYLSRLEAVASAFPLPTFYADYLARAWEPFKGDVSDDCSD